MTVDNIPLNYNEQKAIKSALHKLLKGAISDLDKTNELFIVKRGFEINYRNKKKYRIVLSIDEVDVND